MPRRKRKKNNKLLPIIISLLTIIIVLIGGYFFIKKYNTTKIIPKNLQQTTKVKHNDIYIWKKISNLTWKIKYKPIIGYFYYELIDNKWQIWGIKSNNFDISQFNWKEVSISWTIVDFYKDIPIIKINQVNPLDNTNYNTQNTETWDNKRNIFYFPKYWLIFDFWTNTGYIVTITWEQLYVFYQSWDKLKKLLNIQTFLCNSKSNTNSCKQLNQQFKTLNFDYFISSNGMTFYHIPESPQWFTTTHYIRWYYITPFISKNKLFKITNFIFPYDTDKLKNQISEIAFQTCSSGNITLYKIKNISLVTSWNQILGKILWEDENGNNLECITEINFENSTPILKLLKITKKTNTSKEIKQENIVINTSENGITTTFKHGFNIFIPYKNIVYKQWFKNSNLWVQNLNCWYFIKIKNRKEKDNLDTDPDITIWQCETNLPKDNLQKLLWKDFIIKEKWKYYYIIKYKPNWKNIAENITIK